jgi:hypothetical protein
VEFVVHNHAPAVQKVIVEQQEADGSWTEIAARHTIEFRGFAARPRTRIKRAFSAPVASPDIKLRLRVAGVGQVKISRLQLTDGVHTLHAMTAKQCRLLGTPAPCRGWPDLDAKSPRAIWPIRWL